jgi:cellulose biosynthesis protein BcsQ
LSGLFVSINSGIVFIWVYTIINDAANRFNADIVLIDVGPNLGAINRSVTISSDYIILPVASDLFSLQGIKNIGLTLRNWKREWDDRPSRKPSNLSIEIPSNNVKAVGYIVMQYSALESRTVKSYLKWANRVPSVYSRHVLNNEETEISVDHDKNCIGLLKHYRSFVPMSMEVHKPMFSLKPADGAIGAHLYAVQQCYNEFEKLTRNIIHTCR